MYIYVHLNGLYTYIEPAAAKKKTAARGAAGGEKKKGGLAVAGQSSARLFASRKAARLYIHPLSLSLSLSVHLYTRVWTTVNGTHAIIMHISACVLGSISVCIYVYNIARGERARMQRFIWRE